MTAAFELQTWSAAALAQVEQALSDVIPQSIDTKLGDAMRYAVLDGGKRLRPLLVLAAREALAADAREPAALKRSLDQSALRAACAVELIHAYSLVHDDLPCMDNDVLRRGKPTVHVRFGEAQALLAGDALQALAFELLTPDDGDIPEVVQARLCRLLARAAGHAGMAGGQAIDLDSVGQRLGEVQLRQMHAMKTGALLQACVLMGAACGQMEASSWRALEHYGAALGLAFQVMDDVLDVVADTATLGKTAGKDQDQGKPTYVSLMGLAGAQQHAQELLAQAQQALDQSGLSNTAALQALAAMVVNRNY